MKTPKYVVIAALACVSVQSYADTCRFDRFKLIELVTQALVAHQPETELIGSVIGHYDRKQWHAIATAIDDIAHDNGLTVRDAPEKYEDFMNSCLKYAKNEELSHPKYDAYIEETHNYAELIVKSRESERESKQLVNYDFTKWGYDMLDRTVTKKMAIKLDTDPKFRAAYIKSHHIQPYVKQVESDDDVIGMRDGKPITRASERELLQQKKQEEQAATQAELERSTIAKYRSIYGVIDPAEINNPISRAINDSRERKAEEAAQKELSTQQTTKPVVNNEKPEAEL